MCRSAQSKFASSERTLLGFLGDGNQDPRRCRLRPTRRALRSSACARDGCPRPDERELALSSGRSPTADGGSTRTSRAGAKRAVAMSALDRRMALYYAARHGQGKAPERPSRLSHGGAARRHRSDSQRTGTRAQRQPSCAARHRPALCGVAR